MSKISRGQLGEELVVETLKKIKVYHHLLNNITFVNKRSEMTHQIDHILIHPHGVFVIETKNYFGQIVYDSGTKSWFKIVKGTKSRISNPLLQNKSHEISLYKALNGKYPVISVVVFVKNNAPYFPEDNVINLSDLLLFIDSYPYKKKLTNSEIDKIKEVVEAKSTDVSLKEHVENIEILKTIRKENQNEISYAIENRKCPRCGKAIISKGYNFHCSGCDFKFKL